MAASRLDKVGTIFTRMRGLLKSGAVKEKPLWFDVYESFPPEAEPRRSREAPSEELIAILYPEDTLRAKFYKEYGSPGLIDLRSTSTNYKSISQKFIEKCTELGKQETFDEKQLFENAEEMLMKDGVTLRRNMKRDNKMHQIEDNKLDAVKAN